MRASRARCFLASSIIAFLTVSCCAGAAYADLTLYDDALAAGWEDWSWNAGVDPDNPAPVLSGAHSLAVTLQSAWGALYLHPSQPVPTAGYESLSFQVHGGASGGQRLRLVVNGQSSLPFTPQAGAWTRETFALSALGSPSSITSLYVQDEAGAAQPVFYLDEVILVSGTTGPQDPDDPAAGPALTVDASGPGTPISDDIYGMNFADEDLAASLRLPVRRFGGNSASRYNWKLDAHNTGSDWFYENIPGPGDPAALPGGSASDLFVEQDRRTGTKTLLTAPMMGFVAGTRRDAHPYDCAFKVSKYGAQQSVDPWDQDCGNGVLSSGSAITGNDPADTSAAVSPSFVAEWIAHLSTKYGDAASGGVAYFNLDNEPMLWNSTHRDVHPDPVDYDELRDRSVAYASAVKAADPGIKTLGPATWGWCAYFASAKDGCSLGADAAAHGGEAFTPWYLDQMRAYEETHGTRILDYLDLHYYPQAPGVSLSGAGSAATQALRLRSARSLWDPSYVDESWIGEPVQLIPRMRAWRDEHYPGTRLAVTEYNFGALDNMNGALAQADVLGIFGREGLDLATLWSPPEPGQPGAFAFAMYRNYDGAGSAFGDRLATAASADQDRLSVYAAKRARDGVLTILVVNKTADALTSALSLSGFVPKAQAAVWRYSQASPSDIVRGKDQPVAAQGFSAVFPAASVTLFELRPASEGVLPALFLLLSGETRGAP